MPTNVEEYRRNTFKKSDVPINLVQKLANDGFYYIDQLIMCAFCGRKLLLNLLQRTDIINVRELHQGLGHCRFVQGEYVGNVPMGEDPRRKLESDNSNSNDAHTQSDPSESF